MQKSNFIFFLLAYLPAGSGQMRIHFSPIPNFSVASQEINPILWDVRLSLLAKALGWHRGHGVKIFLEPRPSLSAVNAPGLGPFGLEIHNHRIILVGKDLWHHRVQAMPSPHLVTSLEDRVPCPVILGHLQGWRPPNLPGQSLPMFKTPFHEEIPPDVPPERTMAQLDAVSSKPAPPPTGTHQAEGWQTPDLIS